MNVGRVSLLMGLLLLADSTTAQADSCSRTRCETTPPVALPRSVADFERLRRTAVKTPRGAASLVIYSLLVRERDRELGDQLLVRSVDASLVADTADGPALSASTRRLLDESDRHPHCVRGYVAGSSPATNYAIDAERVSLRFQPPARKPRRQTRHRVDLQICSTGSNNCRPLTVTRDDQGRWTGYRFAAVALPCAAPTGARR